MEAGVVVDMKIVEGMRIVVVVDINAKQRGERKCELCVMRGKLLA